VCGLHTIAQDLRTMIHDSIVLAQISETDDKAQKIEVFDIISIIFGYSCNVVCPTHICSSICFTEYLNWIIEMSFNDLSKGVKKPAGNTAKPASGGGAPSARPETKPVPSKSGAKS